MAGHIALRSILPTEMKILSGEIYLRQFHAPVPCQSGFALIYSDLCLSIASPEPSGPYPRQLVLALLSSGICVSAASLLVEYTLSWSSRTCIPILKAFG